MPPRSSLTSSTLGRPLWSAALTALIAGCGSQAGRSTTDSISDSAGIRIVANATPVWPNGRAWTVADQPSVDVGGGTEPEHQLHQVGGAVVLGDGRILFTNGATTQIRIVSESGRYLGAWGRNGEAPGEYRSLGPILHGPDGTLLVYENNTRVTVLDTAGRYLAMAPRLPGIDVRSPKDQDWGRGTIVPKGTIIMGLAARLLGRSSTSEYLVAGSGSLWRVAGEEIVAGIHRFEEPVLRANPDGTFKDSVGMFLTADYYGDLSGSEPRKEHLPFGRRPRFAFHDDELYYGDGTDYEIRVYSPNGTLRRIIRKLGTRRKVTPGDIERFKLDFRATEEATLAASADQRRTRPDAAAIERQLRDGLDRKLAMMPFPETMPAFDEMTIDALGNLWVRDYQPPYDTLPPRWSVFDTTGKWLGTVITPPGVEIFDIGQAAIVGRWRDDDDVEHVRSYRLRR